jgi:hypothetical protein
VGSASIDVDPYLCSIVTGNAASPSIAASLATVETAAFSAASSFS